MSTRSPAEWFRPAYWEVEHADQQLDRGTASGREPKAGTIGKRQALVRGISGQRRQLCAEVWAFDDESEIAHNEAYAPKEMLARTLAALEQIVAGDAPAETRGSIRIHRFEGFGVLLPA